MATMATMATMAAMAAMAAMATYGNRCFVKQSNPAVCVCVCVRVLSTMTVANNIWNRAE